MRSRHRRLYHRIYLSLLLVAVLSIVGTGLASHALLDRRFESPVSGRLVAESEYVSRSLPAASAPAEEIGKALRRLGDGLHLDLTLVDRDGRPVASTLPSPAVPPVHRPLRPGAPAWVLTARGHAIAREGEDGRLLLVWPRESARSFWPLLAVFFGLMAIGSHKIARSLTRRLETLEDAARRWGEGDLAARVPVQGRDEVARVAERFNWAAGRLSQLVDAQRRMLRNASHEIRSPLARVRMALELVRDSGTPETDRRVTDAVGELDDLDGLVDDLLLASRMETEPTMTKAPVDLGAVVLEEAARVGARTNVAPATVAGDARLLRRLARNLLENAVRHGSGDVEAGVEALESGGARLWVADRGPGVAENERERIFEPFYRGSDAGAGVGLGLALVRQIAERHGGRAACRPRDGGGALFEVTLGA